MSVSRRDRVGGSTRLLVGAALASCALASCALETGGLSGAGAGGGASASASTSTSSASSGKTGSSATSSSATSSSASSASSSASSSGAPPTGDGIPIGAVSFFSGAACPAGWAPHALANGRFIVPTTSGPAVGATTGAALASGEDRTHTHTLTATFSLGSVSYAGLSSGGNGGVGPSGDAVLTSTTDPASTGLPYVQLLACKKAAAPIASALPKGMQMFFEAASCPTGWAPATAASGRLVVGLPSGATANASFGGSALAPSAQGVMPTTHTHGGQATLTTSSHGIALAGGGAAGGFAANGTTTAAVDTGAADTGLPLLALLSCVTP